MVRITLLWMVIAFLAVYAWRDWYKALCGLVLIMAVIEHPDMPKTLGGIQGLNPWNILMGCVLMAWFFTRGREGYQWDLPGRITVLLLLYLTVIVAGFYRMMGDSYPMVEYAMMIGKEPPTNSGMWAEYLINSLKWVIPGILLYDGCRSRERFTLGLMSLLAVYFLIGVQVIRWMPLDAIGGGDDLTARSIKILSNEVGYHRVNLSMMLAGAFWAIISTRVLAERRMASFMIVAAALTVLFAQALTGGRTGYGTWLVVGMLLAVLRWRKYLLLVPVLLLLVAMLVPAAMERMSQGFTAETVDTNTRIQQQEPGLVGDGGPDLYTVTAGRNIAWPRVLDKLAEAPWFGYGREAMQRTGVAADLWKDLGEAFPHPHNAYLQILLDNGVVGAVLVLLFYITVLRYSLSLLKDSQSPVYIAAGGVTLALIVALLVASMGSQSFYPREGAVGMWCAIGLMLRVYVERSRIHANASVPEALAENAQENRSWVQTV
jgi:O-antigen ligase